jgi:putative FmdB family regulatory protein
VPTYSYRCANCDVAFDQYQAFTDDTLTICPNCGEPQLRKVFNSIGVTFNGSGFYRTDSRAKSGAGSSSSTLPSSSSTSGSSTGSSTGDKSAAPAKAAASTSSSSSGSSSSS